MQCRLSSDVYADVSTDHRKYPVFSGYMELLWITAICHWLQTTWLMMDNISHLIVSVWRLIAPPCSKWASKRPFISWNVLPLLVTWILWHLPQLVLSLVEWWEEAQGHSTFFKSSSNFLSLHWSSSWDKTWTNNCAITRLILWGHNNSQFLGNQSRGLRVLFTVLHSDHNVLIVIGLKLQKESPVLFLSKQCTGYCYIVTCPGHSFSSVFAWHNSWWGGLAHYHGMPV